MNMKRLQSLKNTISYVIGVLLLLGCKRATSDDAIAIVYPEDFRKHAVEIHGTQVHLDEEMIYANRFFVYDSLLIVRNNPKSQKNLIEIRNLHTMDLMKSFFSYGEGPEEFLLCQMSLNENKLVLRDGMRDRFTFVNLDSILHPDYKPVFIKYSGDYHEFAPYKSDSAVMLNAYTYKNDKLGINIDVPRLNKASLKKTIVNPYKPSDFDVYPYNVTNGNIIVSGSNQRILYASSNTPDIELYDYNLNLLHSIKIPDYYNEDKITVIQKEDAGLVFNEWLPTATYILSVVNDSFYVLYNGFCYEVRNFSIEKNKDPKFFPLILKISMDGKLQKVYHCDRYLFNMSIVENGKTAYLSGFDEDGNYALYKYVLEK